MKNLLLVVTVIFITTGACNDSGKKIVISTSEVNRFDSIENENLVLLDSLHLRQFHDSARWELYLEHCPDTAILKDSQYLPVSALKLKLGTAIKQNDTLDLLYFYMGNDTSIIYNQLKGGNCITNGVQFKTSENKLIAYIAGEGTFTKTNSKGNMVNNLTPEVISYIRLNRDKLNPWFIDEAKRRMIIK